MNDWGKKKASCLVKEKSLESSLSTLICLRFFSFFPPFFLCSSPK